jgi:hypothetical protein
MTVILAIIGVICLFYLLSKGLQKLGDFLICIGNELSNYAASKRRYETHRDTETKKELTELSRKIDELKGGHNDHDEDFEKRVRKEIDELTDTE